MPDFPPPPVPVITDADKDDIADRTWERPVGTPPTGSRGEHVSRVQSQIDAPTEGSITADGTEQNVLLDETPTATGEAWQEGFIDLSAMASGDTVVIRQYMSIVTPISYKKYSDPPPYSGAQANPLLHITTKPYRYAIKVTLQQTAGTYKSFPYQFFKRKRST